MRIKSYENCQQNTMRGGLKLSWDLLVKYHENRAATLMIFQLHSRSELSKEKGPPHMSCMACHMSSVTRHVSGVSFTWDGFFYKVVELIHWGSVINGAPVQIFVICLHLFSIVKGSSKWSHGSVCIFFVLNLLLVSSFCCVKLMFPRESEMAWSASSNVGANNWYCL